MPSSVTQSYFVPATPDWVGWLTAGATCETGAWENGEDEQPARPPTSAKITINLNILDALRPDIAVTLARRDARAIRDPQCALFNFPREAKRSRLRRRQKYHFVLG